jgi:hypothetical protein
MRAIIGIPALAIVVMAAIPGQLVETILAAFASLS